MKGLRCRSNISNWSYNGQITSSVYDIKRYFNLEVFLLYYKGCNSIFAAIFGNDIFEQNFNKKWANTGKVIQVIGPVVDVSFEGENSPFLIYSTH